MDKIKYKYLKSEAGYIKAIGVPYGENNGQIFNDLKNNTASGSYSHAEGQYTTASGSYSHAEGYSTTASGYYSHAEGDHTTASGQASHAEGTETTASSYCSHAEGYSTKASGQQSHAEGCHTKATSTNDSASTTSSTSKGYYTHAEGYGTVAYGRCSHAEGNGTKASGYDSHAEGYITKAMGQASHAEGYSTTASGQNSHAEGYYTTASGYASHAEGNYTKAFGNYSHTEGQYTTASGGYSHTEGYETTASGMYSHAEGHYMIAYGKGSHAEGGKNSVTRSTISGEGNAIVYTGLSNPINYLNAIIEYNGNMAKILSVNEDGVSVIVDKTLSSTALNNVDVILHYTGIATGDYSHAEGDKTIASGYASHAEGNYTKAFGNYSHTEGINTTASGYCSHAEGYETTASNNFSHTEGSYTTASDYASHAEGNYTKASGIYSHAQGSYTTASGPCSHAEGYQTIALTNQHAQGHYNNTSVATGLPEDQESGTSPATAFVIGNGTPDSRSNAFRVTYEGKTYAKSNYNTTGADYAEYFEWLDGNPNAEDRRGYFVTLDGEKIKLANKDDYILGIISGQPSVIGNSDEEWMGRYIMDDFGAFITEEFEYEEEVLETIMVEEEIEETILVRKLIEESQENENTEKAEGQESDAEDPKVANAEEAVSHEPRYELQEVVEKRIVTVPKIVTKTVTRKGTKYKENPDYDKTRAYIQRADRPEWAAVGMLGVLSVRDDGTCQVNGYCTIAENGIVTAAENGYRVIKRISDNVVKVIFR